MRDRTRLDLSARRTLTVPWSRKFDDPIPLPDGRTIHTLKQAGIYIVGLPKKEAALPHWQRAMETLIAAAEGKDFLIHRKLKHIGSFNDEVAAAICYDDQAMILHGEFARLNFPERKRAASG